MLQLTHKFRIALMLTCTLLQACTSTSDIERLPDGAYLVYAKTPNIFKNKGSTAQAISVANQEANIFCSKLIPGGVAQIISAQEALGAGTKGGEATIKFKCVK